MARVLDLKKRGNGGTAAPSAAVSMQPRSSLTRDMFLATISVVPASIVWIALDHFYIGTTLGVAIFLVAEYGYPAYKSGRIDLAPIFNFVSEMRESIRSRVTSRA